MNHVANATPFTKPRSAVDYFYSAAKHRCRSALWPIFTPALILYLPVPHALPGIDVDDPPAPLYVGMTEDSLKARNHFGHKDSSFSSPRRSLGAILKQKLGLKAVPRGSGKSKTDMTNYRFAGVGEKSLTDWMVEHLEYSFVVLEDGFGDVERALIECLHPPLNLNKWKNPQGAKIMQLREACADEARGAGQSGF
jgi:hypothetical protein